MEIDRKELKYRARQALGRPRPPFRLVALAYVLATSGVFLAVSYLPLPAQEQAGFSSAALFLTLLLSLYSTVVDFGYDLWALWTFRELDPGLGALVQGFSVAGRVIAMEALILLQTWGWAMCLSMAMALPLAFLAPFWLQPPAYFLLYVVLLYAAIVAIRLRYALAPYLLADRPDDGPAAAVRRSVELTRGWKWELFKLDLSFLGWELAGIFLSLLPLGYFLWQSGSFQALAALPPADLGTLLSNFFLWQMGLVSSTLTAQQVSLFQMYFAAADSPAAVLLSFLAVLPVSVWLVPYRAVARSGFYDARLRLRRENAPPMPPL